MTIDRQGTAAQSELTGRDSEPFAEEAKRILKAEMVRRGFSFKRLAAVLATQDDGPTESTQTLINKVNRGRFSFAFFIRVCRAMGMKTVDIAPLKFAPEQSEPSE
ncbi:DUF6471 domain-containing protein [Roseateles violae]|uniref:DUF6471 domain-containing protein n=1 Tax=Roseateles violae TaxID=3058042 RepID=A0ABT8DMQ5_9BURK|nr:DUF6471 domain-containing protein [Pelomonas sp. PFR6]MDN3919402.1 DUF6471 domain-containing protein [Pelomonas sp. PFR6]